jgi:hypothetical protein
VSAQNNLDVELQDDEIPELLMLDLVENTPKASTRVALVDKEGYEEKVNWEQPEDAADYLSDLVGFGNYTDGMSPVDLPDSQEFTAQNIQLEAQAGETLRYEVEVEGIEGATGGYVCKDENGNEYVSSEDGTYRPDEAYTSVVFSAETSVADQEARGEFEEAVRRLEKW